jgi:hypothetical protein
LDKKKTMELVAAIFIAVIFVSSYAAYGGNFGNSGQASNSGANANATTTIPPVSGSARASIVSYGTVLDVNVSCANASAVASSLNGYLNALESNGSISNFYSPENSEILVQLGSYSATALYGALSGRLGKNAACTSFASQATVQLPSIMNVTGGKIRIPGSLRNYPLGLKLSNNMSSSVGVSVLALIAENGTAYQLRVMLNNH